MATSRAAWLARVYGISVEDYEGLLAEQKGVCAICGRTPKTRRLHVDHSHSTGRIRGLLCWPCNGRLLGRGLDAADLHYAAARYLESGGPAASRGWIVPKKRIKKRVKGAEPRERKGLLRLASPAEMLAMSVGTFKAPKKRRAGSRRAAIRPATQVGFTKKTGGVA